MKRLVLAACLASSIGGANAMELSAFVGSGRCNELHAIETERAAILADRRFGLSGVLGKLRINSREFLDTLDACAWDAAHTKAK